MALMADRSRGQALFILYLILFQEVHGISTKKRRTKWKTQERSVVFNVDGKVVSEEVISEDGSNASTGSVRGFATSDKPMRLISCVTGSGRTPSKKSNRGSVAEPCSESDRCKQCRYALYKEAGVWFELVRQYECFVHAISKDRKCKINGLECSHEIPTWARTKELVAAVTESVQRSRAVHFLETSVAEVHHALAPSMHFLSTWSRWAGHRATRALSHLLPQHIVDVIVPMWQAMYRNGQYYYRYMKIDARLQNKKLMMGYRLFKIAATVGIAVGGFATGGIGFVVAGIGLAVFAAVVESREAYLAAEKKAKEKGTKIRMAKVYGIISFAVVKTGVLAACSIAAAGAEAAEVAATSGQAVGGTQAAVAGVETGAAGVEAVGAASDMAVAGVDAGTNLVDIAGGAADGATAGSEIVTALGDSITGLVDGACTAANDVIAGTIGAEGEDEEVIKVASLGKYCGDEEEQLELAKKDPVGLQKCLELLRTMKEKNQESGTIQEDTVDFVGDAKDYVLCGVQGIKAALMDESKREKTYYNLQLAVSPKVASELAVKWGIKLVKELSDKDFERVQLATNLYLDHDMIMTRMRSSIIGQQEEHDIVRQKNAKEVQK